MVLIIFCECDSLGLFKYGNQSFCVSSAVASTALLWLLLLAREMWIDKEVVLLFLS